MEIIEKVELQEKKDYNYIVTGTLLKSQQGTVWLVTDDVDPAYQERIIVDLETGVTDYLADTELANRVNDGTFLIISKSELSILAYE